MRYADRNCTTTEEYEPSHVYVVSGRDVFTKREVTVRIPAAALFAYRQGAMIQDCMGMLSTTEREFLISGMYDSFQEDDD